MSKKTPDQYKHELLEALNPILTLIKVKLNPEQAEEIFKASTRHDTVPEEDRKSTRSVVYAALNEEQARQQLTRDRLIDEIKADQGLAFGMIMCILRCTLTMDTDFGIPYALQIFELCQELRTGGAASTVRTYIYQWKNDKKSKIPPTLQKDDQPLEQPKKRTFAEALASYGVGVGSDSPIFKKPRTLAEFTASDFLVKPRSETVEVSKKDFDIVKDKQNAMLEHLTNFVKNTKGDIKELQGARDKHEQRLGALEDKLGELVQHFKNFVKEVNQRL